MKEDARHNYRFFVVLSKSNPAYWYNVPKKKRLKIQKGFLQPGGHGLSDKYVFSAKELLDTCQVAKTYKERIRKARPGTVVAIPRYGLFERIDDELAQELQEHVAHMKDIDNRIASTELKISIRVKDLLEIKNNLVKTKESIIDNIRALANENVEVKKPRRSGVKMVRKARARKKAVKKKAR